MQLPHRGLRGVSFFRALVRVFVLLLNFTLAGEIERPEGRSEETGE